MYSGKDVLTAETRSSITKSIPSFTKAETAALLGVRAADLGRYVRLGILRRTGTKYLIDYHQMAILLNRERQRYQCVEEAVTLKSATLHEGVKGSNDPWIRNTINEIYCLSSEFHESSVNLVKVPDIRHATTLACRFAEEGLHNNQRVVLLSFEHPSMLFSRFEEEGFDFESHLHTEQLVYMYYKPDVARTISLSIDYQHLFDEIGRLVGNDFHRLILFNVDALINANSEHLVHTSLHQLLYAASHYQVTLLGIFVSSGHVAELLDEGCRAILPGYFVIE